ncbi:MAG TPA: hypothetical protein VF383_12505 [Candidatus Dormibacteraeota bacterium]
MQLIRRTPLVVPIVLIAQLAFAISSAAFQGGNGLLPAGNYHITTSEAHYFFCCGDPTLPTLSVDVSDTTTVANPAAGSPSTTRETDIFVNACGGTNFICGGGCFIAAHASDFTFNSGLSSASLSTAFDPATSQSCQNFPVSLPAFTINVAWSGTGPIGTTRKASTYACVDYHAEVQTLTSNNNATASATSSLVTGSVPAESGSLGSTDQRVHARGVAQDACSSLGLGGGGKGAGPGPTGAGSFQFINQNAAVSVPGGFVSLFSFTNTSKPTGGQESVATETDLTVASFGNPFVFLCFALHEPNTFSFGSGLASATVHAVIDQNTPACLNFTNSSFAPFTVDLTWSQTGPKATIRSASVSTCGSFRMDILSTDGTNPATASGTVSMFPDPVSTIQASINSGDHRFQIKGTAPQGCILRP